MLRSLRNHAWAGWIAVGTIAGCGGSSGDESTGSGTDTGSTGAPVDETTGAGPTSDATTSTGGVTEAPTGTSGEPPDPTTGGEATSATTGEPDDTTSGTSTTGAPVGSAGCGNAAPASGSLELEVEGQQGKYIVSLPPNYDPSQPYPLGFAFHGRNRTGPNCQDGDCAGFQSVMQDQAILVYMTSLGGTGWEGDGEREINVAFFEKVLDGIVADACVDESRVFAAGTSSGAHFVNILGCRFGDRLLAIAPVAGYLPEKDNCVADVAALVIHGYKDPHVQLSAGETARDFWRERNGCSDQTTPPIAEVHASVEGAPETNACADYQGCAPGLPVVWCEHSEGGYDGSTHGWPKFGGQRIWDFVQAL